MSRRECNQREAMIAPPSKWALVADIGMDTMMGLVFAVILGRGVAEHDPMAAISGAVGIFTTVLAVGRDTLKHLQNAQQRRALARHMHRADLAEHDNVSLRQRLLRLQGHDSSGTGR
jgi:hypothetical protein